MFSIIVPAFNEERTIGEVVRSVAAIAASELIVVDDGSSDATADEARRAGARVIRLARNRGKGHALDAGIEQARHDILVFLDADVLGMNETKVRSLVEPVEAGAAMCIGVRYASFLYLNRAFRWLPVVAKLSGQRCLHRRIWEVARRHCSGYRVETALNYFASRTGEIVYIHLPGLTHTIKERKRGLARGTRQRLKMVGHIVVSAAAVRLSRSRRS